MPELISVIELIGHRNPGTADAIRLVDAGYLAAYRLGNTVQVDRAQLLEAYRLHGEHLRQANLEADDSRLEHTAEAIARRAYGTQSGLYQQRAHEATGKSEPRERAIAWLAGVLQDTSWTPDQLADAGIPDTLIIAAGGGRHRPAASTR